MSKSDEYYCPNPYCEQEKLVDGQKECPKCGAWGQRIDMAQIVKLQQQKKRQADRPLGKSAGAGGDKKNLFSDDMTDEQVRMLIFEDMSNLAMHEAGTAWMHLGTVLSLNSTDQMLGSGLKALIDQNKIIIRQNELIIRGLKKLAEKNG